MSGTKADAWNSLLTLLGLVTCVCVFPYKSLGYHFFTTHVEQWTLYGITAVCTVCHVHYGASVVRITYLLTIITRATKFMIFKNPNMTFNYALKTSKI